MANTSKDLLHLEHKHNNPSTSPLALGFSLSLWCRFICIYIYVGLFLFYLYFILCIIFCAESTLLVCKKDSFPQPQIPVPEGKPVTAPVPKSQGTHYPSFSSQFIIRMHYETELLWLIFVHPLKHIFSIFKQHYEFLNNIIYVFSHTFSPTHIFNYVCSL